MATPTYVRTTVSKDGTKLRDEYSDGSFKNVRPNPAAIPATPAAPVAATAKSGPETRLAKAAASSAYAYESDPEYIKRLDEIHKSNPSPVVTKEQYEELEKLHNAALAADPTASGKETPEAKAFQIKYHD